MYSSKIEGFSDLPSDTFSQIPKRTVGGIVIKPPLHIGPAFEDAVLGRERGWVHVREVLTTGDETVLIAESGRGDSNNRHSDIQILAHRIVTLANHPESVIAMSGETPFPEGYDREF